MTTDTSETTSPAVGLPLDAGVGRHIPTRGAVDALMKRCQIGVGGRKALDDAHSIMADCYGTLGALMLEVEALRDRIDRIIASNRQREAEMRTYMRR